MLPAAVVLVSSPLPGWLPHSFFPLGCSGVFELGSETAGIYLGGAERTLAEKKKEDGGSRGPRPSPHPGHAVRPPGFAQPPSLPSWLPEQLSALRTKRPNPFE